MNSEEQKNAASLKRMVFWYNLIPNLIWSILNLVPISIFCYQFLNLNLLYVFLGVSFLSVFLPNTFYHRIQLSRTTAVYHKIGVRFINKFTQNGQIINRLIQRKWPHYRVVFTSKSSVQSLVRQTYVFEKFHFLLFVFFNFLMAYALAKSLWSWAGFILLANLIYNVYPCFLQQYIRLKLTPSLKR